MPLLLAAWQHYLFGILMFLTSTFVILVVLVQRGRGGGLSGAFGGMGGQSAFGTKAGDTFTRITMGAAFIWVLLCMAAILVMKPPREFGPKTPGISGTGTGTSTTQDAGSDGTPAGGADGGTAPGGTTDADANK